MATTQKPSCFVVSPIGEPGSDPRKRSDKVLAHVFEAALSEDYKVTRADKISEPGLITSQILRALQDSDLVIADLTEHNANVFYELAVRHAVEKPVIHVIDSRWKIPFDVAGFRTIVFDFTDLDSVADAIKQLKQQASEIRSGKQGETPIKVANITRPSKQDPENTVLLKQAVEAIAAVRSEVSRLGDVIGSEIGRVENAIRIPLQWQIDYLTNVVTPAASLSPSAWNAVMRATLSDRESPPNSPIVQGPQGPQGTQAAPQFRHVRRYPANPPANQPPNEPTEKKKKQGPQG